MESKSWLTCTLLLAAVAASPAQALACSSDELKTEVKQIGVVHGDDFDFQPILDCFVAHGAEAAGLLVHELHTARGSVIGAGETAKYPTTMHMIWVLRSLYYMTGIIFRAGSVDDLKKLHLPEEREYWLAFHAKYHDNQVNMFSIWDSRGTLYIAPKDVQEAVIEKWNDWYAKDGASFQYAAHGKPRGMWYAGYDDQEMDLGS